MGGSFSQRGKRGKEETKTMFFSSVQTGVTRQIGKSNKEKSKTSVIEVT